MAKSVLVIGGGVIGVTTAYELLNQGYSVAIVDRQPQAGMETSYANGGQLSVSHAEPWATPSAPWQVLRWLSSTNSPLYFRPSLDPKLLSWMASWLWNCRRSATDANTRELTKLATESVARIDAIAVEHRIAFSYLKKGIIHFYRDENSFKSACYAAEVMRDAGLEMQVCSVDQLFALEPALGRSQEANAIVGGTYAPNDASGDAKKFTQGLLRVCTKRGLKFINNATFSNWNVRGDRAESVVVTLKNGQEHTIHADYYVIAAGSYSRFITEDLGERLNIYPAKGSSVTVPVLDRAGVAGVSLTDDENKIVYSRLGNYLRIAGTAELAGWDNTLNMDRCHAVEGYARQLYGDKLDWSAAKYWSGLRPTTPSNVPIIKKVDNYSNIVVNSGHGTLGWTLSAGSAVRTANLITTLD